MDMKTKAVMFAVALRDVYREEDDRESQFMGKLEMTEESAIEDFTAMLYGLFAVYCGITGEDVDILGFTAILTKLAVINLIQNNAQVE